MFRLTPFPLIFLVAMAPARAMPPDFVRIATLAPDVVLDIRYARDDNFLGEAAPGYDFPACWLRQKAAQALSRAASAAASAGARLVVFDCYRPGPANAAFMRWLSEPAEPLTQAKYFPRLTKAQVFSRGYIVRSSPHSQGFAVSAGLLTQGGRTLDFGGDFDFFDSSSAPASFEVDALARTNRAKLAGVMSQNGFVSDRLRWWEFELPHSDAPAYDNSLEQ